MAPVKSAKFPEYQALDKSRKFLDELQCGTLFGKLLIWNPVSFAPSSKRSGSFKCVGCILGDFHSYKSLFF